MVGRIALHVHSKVPRQGTAHNGTTHLPPTGLALSGRPPSSRRRRTPITPAVASAGASSPFLMAIASTPRMVERIAIALPCESAPAGHPVEASTGFHEWLRFALPGRDGIPPIPA